jgi:hypothetical protein
MSGSRSLLWERKVKIKNEEKAEKPFARRGKFATHLKSIPSMLRAQSANKNLPAIDTSKSDIPKLPPLEASSLMTKTNVSAISQGVLDALADDPDAEKSLADIRRILAGPTRRLQDARFDEFVSTSFPTSATSSSPRPTRPAKEWTTRRNA